MTKKPSEHSATPRTDAFIARQEAGGISIWAALVNIQHHARQLERDRARLVEALRNFVENVAAEPDPRMDGATDMLTISEDVVERANKLLDELGEP
jgi:hypothetical protein